MAKHTIVRTDSMMGTKIGSYLENVIVVNNNSSKTAIDADNGLIVTLGDKKAGIGDRETYYASAATTTSAIGKVIAIETDGVDKFYVIEFDDEVEALVVASVELSVSEDIATPADFYNKAGSVARAFRIHKFDQFSVTAEGISGTLAVGNSVKATNGKFAKAE